MRIFFLPCRLFRFTAAAFAEDPLPFKAIRFAPAQTFAVAGGHVAGDAADGTNRVALNGNKAGTYLKTFTAGNGDVFVETGAYAPIE
jgi:hypothetical protein